MQSLHRCQMRDEEGTRLSFWPFVSGRSSPAGLRPKKGCEGACRDDCGRRGTANLCWLAPQPCHKGRDEFIHSFRVLLHELV
jgi:hypothetical protein